MTTWWHDLIKLLELSTGLAQKPKTPGIYYAVKCALDRDRLIEDIGFVLERGLLENRAPAGFIVGAMRPGSVGLSFSREERETLHDNGINAIVVKNGMPFVWGQRFHNATGEIHSICDHYGRPPGLTPEFRAWISEPMMQASFQPEPVFGHIAKRQTGDRMLRERFKLRRYVEMTEDEVVQNERAWAAGAVSTTLAPPPAQKVAIAPPTVTGERVHALHRAIGARPHQIGLVDLDKR